ncbi:hypothetical protein [Vibrio sp. 10N.261.51.F12]|uniref:hypothetical protein n=1 Tax=Vibrio sp. 10N.261.51.F12 TaxID=3229679 RepID=UPI00354D4CE4
MTKPKWRTLILCSVITQITAMTALESKVNELDSDNDGDGDALDVYPWESDRYALPIHTLPTIIEAEDYDREGQNVAFFDTSEENLRRSKLPIRNQSPY